MTISTNYRRWLYVLVVLLVVIAGLYLSGWIFGVLQACGNILALYFTAWLLQFFFAPIVDFLTRRRLPRLVAVAYVYLVLALVVVIALVSVVPTIYSEGRTLANSLSNPNTYKVISNVSNGIEHFLVTRLNVPEQQIKDFTQQYSFNLQKGALGAGENLQQIIRGYLTPSNAGSAATTVVSIFNTLTTVLVNFVIVLILAFYMTLDGPMLMRRAVAYFPPAVGELLVAVETIVYRKFAGYLRGQLILAICYGVLTYIIAAYFGLQYQIFIALFAAVMMLIPFIGTYAALVPPIIFFVVGNPSFPVAKFLLLLLLLIGSQQIVINFLSPRVMGSAVGMHPLLVVLGLLLGIKVAGLWGAIFGVPVFGVIIETADLIYRRVMDRRFGFQPVAVDAPSHGRPGHGPGPPMPDESDEELARDMHEGSGKASRASVVLQPPPAQRDIRS